MPHNRRFRATMVLVFVAAGVAMVLYALGGWPRILVHLLVNQVCMGVSAGKIFFALIFAGVFCLRAAFLQERESRVTASRLSTQAWWFCIIIGLAGSLLSAVTYARSMGLDLGTVSFHWRAGINSVNAISHIHTSKAIIALTLEGVGLQRLNEDFDTGFAYARIVPAWNSIIIGVAFLAAVTLSLWFGPRWASGFRRVSERIAATLVLSLACGAAAKSILDGGPLAYDLIAGLLAILLLAHATSLNDLMHRWRVPCILVVAWIFALVALTGLGALRQLECAAARLSLYASVMSVPTLLTAARSLGHLSSVQRWRWIGIPVLCLLVCVGAVASDLRVRLLPLVRRAPEHAIVYHGGGLPETVPIAPGQSIAATYLAAHDNPLRARHVSVASRDGHATGVYADLILLDTTSHTLEFAPNPSLRFVRADVVTEGTRQPRHRLRSQIEMDCALGPVMYTDGSGGQVADNERFVGYFLLDEYLRTSGVQEYVCVPYMQYREQSQPATLSEFSPR